LNKGTLNSTELNIIIFVIS